MEYGAAPLSSPLPPFRRNNLPPSSRVKLFSDLWILCLLETCGCHCLLTRRRMGEKWSPKQHRPENVKTCCILGILDNEVNCEYMQDVPKMCVNFRM